LAGLVSPKRHTSPIDHPLKNDLNIIVWYFLFWMLYANRNTISKFLRSSDKYLQVKNKFLNSHKLLAWAVILSTLFLPIETNNCIRFLPINLTRLIYYTLYTPRIHIYTSSYRTQQSNFNNNRYRNVSCYD
jgi:hypothetical protein